MKILAILILFFFSNTFIFLEFERLWEIPGTKITSIHKTYDAGIVLSGMATYDQDLQRLNLQTGADRIWNAITLYKKGIIKKIIISGKNGSIVEYGLDEATQFKKDLVAWGIPENNILTEDQSKNTFQNAVYTKKLLQNEPEIHSLLLITSGYHMRRAMGCFEKQGLHPDTFSTNVFNGKNRIWNFDHLVVPDFNTFLAWNKLVKEWVGYLAYKVTGKL